MKYYVCEGTPNGEYNASSKARKDVEYTLNKLGFGQFYIQTKYGVQTNKLLKVKQLLDYRKNCKIWMKTISKLQKNDILLIQYPLTNVMLGFVKVMKELQKREIKTVLLIHDLDSLRFTGMPRIAKEDKEIVENSTYVIAHNKKMKEKIIDMCNIDKEKIIELEIFDYITEDEIKDIPRKKDEPVIIAGNLSKEKAEYLKDLKKVKNTRFNLYGKGYEKDEEETNVEYKGAFLPEELLNNLEGSFGLVWDGTSVDSCQGLYGGYLKYNNPHKVSLYLTAGLPVIVWKKSAMADFITKNKLGIIVDKLEEISKKISELTKEEYEEMISNAKNVSNSLRKGKYLSKAIEKLEI